MKERILNRYISINLLRIKKIFTIFTLSRKQLIARIEDVTLTVIEQISSGRLPQISYSQPRNYTQTDVEMIENDPESQFHEEPERNVEETERKGTTRVTQDFASKRSKHKFALMMTVMATAHRLLITNTTLTRRSLYYDLKNEKTSNLVPEQRCLDQAVYHVANLLNCAPWDLSESPLFSLKKFNFELFHRSSTF